MLLNAIENECRRMNIKEGVVSVFVGGTGAHSDSILCTNGRTHDDGISTSACHRLPYSSLHNKKTQLGRPSWSSKTIYH